jgi:hypothetical protein
MKLDEDKLTVKREANRITFDLTYHAIAPGAEEIPELGLGHIPVHVVIEPGSFRYHTYVFRFPLRLDLQVSDVESIDAPRDRTEVKMVFGYGIEPMGAFTQREQATAPEPRSPRSWKDWVRAHWQKVVATDAVMVDFSRDDPEP